MKFESRKGQNEKKKKKKLNLQFVKTFFFYNFFWVNPLALHFKDYL